MPQSRELAAIMFTDIVGYSSLMGDDEQHAFEMLDQNRRLQKPLIDQFKGRWIKETGDGMLASFSTVTDAVNCACSIIQGSAAVNGLQLRIGIHQAEVIFENGDVFGDGVNIASRLQSLAPIGGICISETVRNNVVNKKEFKTRFLKEEMLKNVKEPVRIYEVVFQDNRPEGQVSVNLTTIKTPFHKSIAVLPFVNMSSDPEQEFFSDGLTEEIIADLSQLEKLLVISRSSVMTFKGTNKKIKQIAAEVNVRYILEGSVRKSGNNLRITAQLIDALNDSHLWAEKYTGTMEDIFDIQEKVSRSIVKALDLKLTLNEESQIYSHPIQNARAYECYIRARQEMWKLSEQGLDNAVILVQQGLGLMPDNALLYATLSTAYLFFSHFPIRPDPSNLKQAHLFASKSLAIDANCPQAYFVYGSLEFKMGKLQEASHIFKKVLSLDKNNVDALVWLIVAYIISGRSEAARPLSIKLSEIDPLIYISRAQIPGLIEFWSGNFQASLPYYREWLRLDPGGLFTRFNCSWNFALNDKPDESIAVLDTMINETPSLIFGKFARFFKSALRKEKKTALEFATDGFKQEVTSVDYFIICMAYCYALIKEKEEAMNWLNKSLEMGQCPYPMILKMEIFHQVFKDHQGFHDYIEKVKKRSQEFII